MNKLKTIFIAALFETALVLCVGCANLLLKPITYMLKFDQFPKMTLSSTIAGIATLCIIIVVFIVHFRTNRNKR